MLVWPELILAGAELGLAAGAGCLVFCAPVAGAAMLASGERGGRGGARSLGSFLVGRFAGYCLFGAVVGALGETAAWNPGSGLALAATVLLAAALIATGFAAGHSSWFEHRLCPAAGARWSKLPLALGFLSGLNICPAFVLAGTEALGAGGALGGIVFFAGFYAGTSVWLLPLAFLPMAWLKVGRERVARLARATAIIVGAIFLARSLVLMRPSTSIGGPAGDAVHEMFPGATRIRYFDAPARFEVTRAGGALPDAWVALAVGQGFGGSVPVLTAIDREGRILAVKILECRETPSYLTRIDTPEVLRALVGRSYAETISLAGVDAISSATVTAVAVESAVRSGARTVAVKAIGLEPPDGTGRPRRAFRWWDALAVIYVCAVAFVFRKARSPRWRWATLAMSIVVLGLVAKSYVSVADFSRALVGAWPAWEMFAAWYVFFFGVLIITFLRGRIYCRLMCPFGALCTAAAKVPVPNVLPSRRVLRALGLVRWILLAATVAAFAFTGSAALFAYEPYAPLFQMPLWLAAGATAPIALAVVAIVASAFVPRLWCRFLCPAGAALEIIARASPFGGKVDAAVVLTEGARDE
jgi:polyferredoxin